MTWTFLEVAVRIRPVADTIVARMRSRDKRDAERA